MSGLDSYYALEDAREMAAKDGKDWDRMPQDLKDEYIAYQMKKRGYEKGDYQGQGASSWVKK